MATIHQFRPRDDVPPAANDHGRQSADTSKAQRKPLLSPTAKTRLGAAGAFLLAGTVTILKVALYVARILLFGVLSVLRIFLRPLLSFMTFALAIGLAFVWFGYDHDAPRRASLLWGAGIGAVGCVLLRFYYDELLAWLSPSRVQIAG
jgi:hypothetical protein